MDIEGTGKPFVDRTGLKMVADLSEGFWHGASEKGDRIFYDAIVDFALLDVEGF